MRSLILIFILMGCTPVEINRFMDVKQADPDCADKIFEKDGRKYTWDVACGLKYGEPFPEDFTRGGPYYVVGGD